MYKFFNGYLSKIMCFLILSIISGISISQLAKNHDYLNMPITMTPDAVGPITRDSPYELNYIQTQFPNLKIIKKITATEDMPYEMLVAYKDKLPLLTIVPVSQLIPEKYIPITGPGKILCVTSASNAIKNSLGANIGSIYKDIFKHYSHINCVSGWEHMQDLVICHAPNADNILYAFGGEGRWAENTKAHRHQLSITEIKESNYRGHVPPADKLKELKLKEIIWLADTRYFEEARQMCLAEGLRK